MHSSKGVHLGKTNGGPFYGGGRSSGSARPRTSPLFRRPPPGHFSSQGGVYSPPRRQRAMNGSDKNSSPRRLEKAMRSCSENDTISLEEYENDLVSCCEEIESIREHSKKRIENLVKKLKARDAKVSKAEQEAAFKSRELAKVLNLLAEATSTLLSREADCKKLQTELADARIRFAAKITPTAHDVPFSVGSEVRSAEDPATDAEEEADEEDPETETEESNQGEVDDINNIRARYPTTKAEARMLEELKSSENRCKTIQDENEALAAQLASAQKKASGLEERMQSDQSRIESLENEVAAKIEKIKELRENGKAAEAKYLQSLAAANARAEKLESETTRLREEKKASAKKKDGVKKDLGDLIAQLEAAKKSASFAERSREEIEKKAKNDASAFQKQIDELTAAHTSMKKRHDEREKDLQKRIKQAERERDHALLDMPPPPGMVTPPPSERTMKKTPSEDSCPSIPPPPPPSELLSSSMPPSHPPPPPPLMPDLAINPSSPPKVPASLKKKVLADTPQGPPPPPFISPKSKRLMPPPGIHSPRETTAKTRKRSNIPLPKHRLMRPSGKATVPPPPPGVVRKKR